MPTEVIPVESVVSPNACICAETGSLSGQSKQNPLSFQFTPKFCLSIPKWLFQKLFPMHRDSADIRLMFYSGLYFIFALYMMSIAASYSDRVNINAFPSNSNEKVPDILLDLAREISSPTVAIEAAADACSGAAMTMLLLRGLTLRRRSATVLRRIFLIVGTMLLLRGVCIAITVLPTPQLMCRPDYRENIFLDALLLSVRIRVACGDVFFSGHTLFMTLNFLFWQRYTTNFIFTLPHAIILLGGLTMLLLSSFHYSIDIMISLILSFTLFQTYHLIAENRIGLNCKWGNVLRKFDLEHHYRDCGIWKSNPTLARSAQNEEKKAENTGISSSIQNNPQGKIQPQFVDVAVPCMSNNSLHLVNKTLELSFSRNNDDKTCLPQNEFQTQTLQQATEHKLNEIEKVGVPPKFIPAAVVSQNEEISQINEISRSEVPVLANVADGVNTDLEIGLSSLNLTKCKIFRKKTKKRLAIAMSYEKPP